MLEHIHKENSSGTIRIQNDKIFWDYNNKNITEIYVKDIVVIGEYTNSKGPWFEDWFITFVTGDGQWQSIPWYADNRKLLQDYLCERFNTDFSVSYLTGSFEWNSIVRFPKHLENKPLFV